MSVQPAMETALKFAQTQLEATIAPAWLAIHWILMDKLVMVGFFIWLLL